MRERYYMKIIKSIYKKVIFIIIALYVISIFVSQQKNLNNYRAEVDKYETKIAKEQERKQDLIKMKENVDSSEYIEEIARERVGMYLPHEKGYIDIGQ